MSLVWCLPAGCQWFDKLVQREEDVRRIYSLGGQQAARFGEANKSVL